MPHIALLPISVETSQPFRKALHTILSSSGAAFRAIVSVVAASCTTLVGTGITIGKAHAMIYVEPYQARRRDERPER